ncbi:M6 family metalloprotease domain-containing protein [Chloroflexia bacterium SDU3-3]|nr:M6 family metalloprotease domain-containing protein [Chloroflexia bacterium SDU3-3]
MKRSLSYVWSRTAALMVLGLTCSLVAAPAAQAQRAPQEDGPGAAATPTTSGRSLDLKRDLSLQPPRETLLGAIARSQLGAGASAAQLAQKREELLDSWNAEHYHGPNAAAYAKLQQNEQRALAANSSPKAMGLGVEGTLRLFAVMVDFGGTDTATAFSHRTSVDDPTCITENVTATGPLHNQIPSPGPLDNFTFWQPSFEREYYEKLVFSTEGITERVRLDLTDPEDGKPGINLAGQTMRNYYEEVSGGHVQFDGGPKGVIGWVTLPHSEAYYGASACYDGESADMADMDGLPSNPYFGSGPKALIADLITEINKADPSFPWKDYDTDGDGLIDHVVIFHAGKDKSSGGGVQGYQALWAHRSSVPQNDPNFVAHTKDPSDPTDRDIRFNGYTLQYEDVETGVLVHEFGHDLGLPDLYDTSRAGESNVVWWDLMSTGSNTGKLIGTHPTHMSAWDKYALGWADYKVVEPSAAPQELKLGQTSNPPAGTTQAVRVNLPPNHVTYTELQGSSNQAWWSNNDQNGAQNTITRDLSLAGRSAPLTLKFDIDHEIEEDWDYLFVEVSTNGGTTYTTLPGVIDGTADPSTVGGPSYTDPNGNLKRFAYENAYAYTGSSGGWERVAHDLSAYAGQNIKLRFRYNTDEASLLRGSFIDNIVVREGITAIFSDGIESSDLKGWVPAVAAGIPGETLGAGWGFSDGTQEFPEYYLLEWRNTDGFDRGLKYGYNTIFSDITADGREQFRVDHTPVNAPGLLVWLRDSRYGVDPFGATNAPIATLEDLPSEGPKGGLLIVDANPQPLRGPRNGKITTGVGTFPYAPGNNWSGRVQAINSAFNLQGSPAVTLTLASLIGSDYVYTPTLQAALPAVNGFHDALGYYPGVERLDTAVATSAVRARRFALSDPDASVVVPASGYYSPKTPAEFVADSEGTTPSAYETIYSADIVNFLDLGSTAGVVVTGQHSGNPGSTNLQYGYHFEVVGQADNGSYGTIRVYNTKTAADSSATITPDGGITDPVTVKVVGQNVGSPAKLTVYSDFDEAAATYVEGSASDGAVPVKATLSQVQQILATKGVAGLDAVRAAPGEAIAVVLTGSATIDSGAKVSFSYKLTRTTMLAVRVQNKVEVNDGAFTSLRLEQFGKINFLPISSK